MDIKEGDILVIGTKQYPIRSVADWSRGGLTLSEQSFSRLATVTASTMRSPNIVSGKRGSPVTNIASLKCTPPDPVDPDVARRLAVSTPFELLEVYTSDTGGFVQLILEDTKI